MSWLVILCLVWLGMIPLTYRALAKILQSKRFVGKGDAGVKSAAVAVRRSLAYAPCGDAATPSVTFGDSSPKPTPKKYYVFFWGPRGGAKGMNAALASKITEPSRVPLRFVAAEQISQAAAFLAAMLRCSLLLFPQNSLTRLLREPFS